MLPWTTCCNFLPVPLPLLLPLPSVPVSGLMRLKAVRTLQERRAARRGFITFGGDDKYKAPNVHSNIHDACMVARIQMNVSLEEFELRPLEGIHASKTIDS